MAMARAAVPSAAHRSNTRGNGRGVSPHLGSGCWRRPKPAPHAAGWPDRRWCKCLPKSSRWAKPTHAHATPWAPAPHRASRLPSHGPKRARAQQTSTRHIPKALRLEPAGLVTSRAKISPDRPVYASFVAPKRRYGAEKQCNTRCCDQIAADDSIIRQTPGPGSSHPRCRLASGQATNPGVQMMAAAGGPRGQWERRASATRQACAGAGSGPASGCGVTASTATAPGGAIMGKHKGQCRDADELGASLSLTSTHFIPVAPHASVDACGETMGAATDAPTNKTNHSNTQRASNLWLRSLFMRGSIRKAKPHPPQSRQRQGITLACHAQAQQHQVRDGEKGPHQGFVNHQHLQSGGA